jgi:hypothetical protein
VRWTVVLLFAIGCKYPDPGFDMPGDDAAVDAAVDAGIDEMELPRCPPFTTADNKYDVPGIAVGGISVAEDESFAVSFLYQDRLGYTFPPFGDEYLPSNLANNITSLHIVPDGSAVYITDFNTAPYARRAVATSAPETWMSATESGLPEDAFAGRPTSDDSLMAFTDSSRDSVEEWERMSGAWMFKRSYTPAELGFGSGAQILSASLTIDGDTLLITAGGANDTYGVYWRARGSGGTFAGKDGAYGGRIVDGTYDHVHATLNCSHLWVHETTTGKIERYDLLP